MNFATRITMSATADRQPLVAVLAAGLASRFGGGKLDADCAGKPLGQWALDRVAEAGLSPGVIVVGRQPPLFARNAAGWQVLTNRTPEEGQGTSVALACREGLAQARGVMILLADMPLVQPRHLQRLAASRGTAATRYADNRIGVPVRITASDLSIFASLSGDSGAGKLLRSLDTLDVIDAPPQSLRDVDDAESLAAICKILGEP